MMMTSCILAVSICTADINGDVRVDGRDLTTLLRNYSSTFLTGAVTPAATLLAAGHTPEEAADIQALERFPEYLESFKRGDINGDLTIDSTDLTILLSQWQCGP